MVIPDRFDYDRVDGQEIKPSVRLSRGRARRWTEDDPMSRVNVNRHAALQVPLLFVKSPRQRSQVHCMRRRVEIIEPSSDQLFYPLRTVFGVVSHLRRVQRVSSFQTLLS